MNKSTLELIKSIVEKCAQANPEIITGRSWKEYDNTASTLKPSVRARSNELITYRPIQLADVLYAIGNNRNLYAHSSGILIDFDGNKEGCDWNLLKPLHDQSEETLRFIDSILV